MQGFRHCLKSGSYAESDWLLSLAGLAWLKQVWAPYKLAALKMGSDCKQWPLHILPNFILLNRKKDDL